MSDSILNEIEYTVACAFEFASAKNISVKESFNYLLQFKGIEFLKTHYPAEHLLSFDDVTED